MSPKKCKESLGATYFTIENEGHIRFCATELSFSSLNAQKLSFHSRVMKAPIFSTVILHTFVHFLGPAGPKVVIPYESGEGEGRFASRNT